MNHKLLDTIRIANREFRDFIDQVAQSGAQIVESRGAIRRLEKVNLRLQDVSQFLAAESRPSAPEPEAAYEVMKYRENLRALRNAMETLQFSLLAEKARLENVRANMQAACAWATSLRETS
jgi:division protein CdvB (Snf7/Vps24/ESCRT-III family)